MREYQDRRRWRLNYPRSSLVLLALLIILLVKPIYQLYQKDRLVSAERQSLLEEVAELKARQAKLAAEIARLATDRGVEEAIRERFNVVKTGEGVITLVTPPTSAGSGTSAVRPSTWWQTFLNWFK